MGLPRTTSMAHTGNDSPSSNLHLVESIMVGLVVGISHTIAETILMGWYSVGVGLLDILLFAAVYGALGSSIGILLLTGIRVKQRVSRRSNSLRPPDATRRSFFTLGVLAYGLVAAKLVVDRASGTGLYVCLGLLFAVLGMITLQLGAGRRSPTMTVVALLTLSFAVQGLTLAAAALTEIPAGPRRVVLFTGLAVPPLLGLLVLAIGNSHSRVAHQANDPLKAVCLLAVFFGGTFVLWMWFLPVSVCWHISKRTAAAATAPEHKPNVVLAVLDTVRCQSLDLFGYDRPTMPLLKQFAETECHVVREMMANAPSTLPSHAAMFTGHFSYSHGAHKPFLADADPPAYAYPLGREVPTLAECLSQAGYRTAAIVGNCGALGSYGIDRGFGHYDVRASDAHQIHRISWLFALAYRGRSVGAFLRDYVARGRVTTATLAFDPWRPPYRRAEHINDLAFQWLTHHKDKPFFLFLNFMDAHSPYVAPREYRDRFVKPDERISWIGFPARQFWRCVRDGGQIPKLDANHARSLYDAELCYLDTQIDRLLRHLRQIDCYENSLILIVSDHGEGFLEHGMMRHSSTLYGTQVSVPLLIKFPVETSDSPPEVAANFQHIDVLPSVLTVLDIPGPKNIQGSPWATGRDYALSECFVHGGRNENYRRELCAVCVGNYKYIRSTDGTEELYDVGRDPHEARNLIGTLPDIEKRLRQIADNRDERLPRQFWSPKQEDDALMSRLRSLGYVDLDEQQTQRP